MTSNIGNLKKWVHLRFVFYFQKHAFSTGNMLFSVTIFHRRAPLKLMFNQQLYQTARQCCLCRDGGGCLYTVIQWKTATSVLPRRALANGTGGQKVCAVHKRTLTVLPSEKAPACRNRPWQFSNFVFFFFSSSSSSSNSSSSHTVAHEL